MKAINPEFFKMDEIGSQLSDNAILPAVYASVYQGTDRILNTKAENRRKSSRLSKRYSSSLSSGGGGHSSWGGGGGGFSGGGGGGGIR